MKTDIIKLIEQIDAYTKEHVKEKRYEHSVRVAEMAARMCRQYGLDENTGYLAGIGHDMCKDMDEKELIETAAEDGEPVTSFELKRPKLLHGRAAAVYMKEKFEITDFEILEAVAHHTSGKIGMCDLAKIIFLADKIEPGRPQSTEEYRENLLKLDLPSLFLSVLNENYEYLIKNGIEIDNNTKEIVKFYNSVK